MFFYFYFLNLMNKSKHKKTDFVRSDTIWHFLFKKTQSKFRRQKIFYEILRILFTEVSNLRRRRLSYK